MAKSATAPKKPRSIFYIGKFEHHIGSAYSEMETKALADDLLDWIEKASNYWLKDFFTQRRITQKTVARMKTDNEYFAEIYTLAQDIQESKLLDKGLTGSNTALCIFALKNVAGWRDSRELANAQDQEDNDFVMIDNWGNPTKTTKTKEVK